MKSILIPAILSLILFAGCLQEQPADYNYITPQNRSDGLTTGSLTEVNLDSVLINQLVKSVNSGKYKEVHSVLIHKDGKLVFEEYFPGSRFNYEKSGHLGKVVDWGIDSLHRVMSVTKSITSACVGIAINNGFIKSADQSIFEYLPNYRYLMKDGKENITIANLLSMTSGLKGNEWLMPYRYRENDIMKVYFSEDPVNQILSAELQFTPGDVFQYYGGSNFLLGEIIRNASGMDMTELAEQYLFEPLGIRKYTWLRINKGVVDGAGGLFLTPRDMLKIGVLFLNNGEWNGKQIISEEWVYNSAIPLPGSIWMNNWDDHWGMRGYSYSWWTHSFVLKGIKTDMFYAAGWGGQYIMVIPDLYAVIVFTGGNYTSYRPPFDLFKKYILPAFNK